MCPHGKGRVHHEHDECQKDNRAQSVVKDLSANTQAGMYPLHLTDLSFYGLAGGDGFSAVDDGAISALVITAPPRVTPNV